MIVLFGRTYCAHSDGPERHENQRNDPSFKPPLANDPLVASHFASSPACAATTHLAKAANQDLLDAGTRSARVRRACHLQRSAEFGNRDGVGTPGRAADLHAGLIGFVAAFPRSLARFCVRALITRPRDREEQRGIVDARPRRPEQRSTIRVRGRPRSRTLAARRQANSTFLPRAPTESIDSA